MTRSPDTYRMLGRSGLRVSPLALGALTFGADWGWRSERDEARQIFDGYLDRGGNFIERPTSRTGSYASEELR
jgi:aryl-alcohol dehydrogenase-like predicted oxidoreductase